MSLAVAASFAQIVEATVVLIGIFVGIIACHKGLTCKMGSDGVGRAVNQTVVIAFVGIWGFNAFWNLAYLTAFPAASVLHG